MPEAYRFRPRQPLHQWVVATYCDLFWLTSNMYIVVVGAGPTGRRIVELATADQHEVVVVEANEERAGGLSADFDCLVLYGDAASRPLLEEAGVPGADALIATTDDDATNLMVVMLGREMGERSYSVRLAIPATRRCSRIWACTASRTRTASVALSFTALFNAPKSATSWSWVTVPKLSKLCWR